jgi:amidase
MLNHLSLVEMAARVRERQVSPVELVEAHLRQIERHNPALNAFVLVLAEEARAAAAAAERALAAGADTGPLHGVPVTVKDSFDMNGFCTSCGSRLFCHLKAKRDAAAVRRMREAGAIVLGKTNCPEFLASYETDNYIAGRTNNPWDLERTPGGSSGGEAAAIAAFLSAGGVGSDGGGSIRVPAHFTGIAGLKPTPGRVSGVGHLPPMGQPAGLLGVAGPMARSAADVRALFEVLAGYDAADPFSAPVPLRTATLEGVRVGVMEQFLKVPVQPAIRDAVLAAARCVGDLGFAAEPFAPSGVERAPNVWWFFFGELPARITHELIAGREADVHWTSTESLKRALEAPEATGRRVLEMLDERERIRGEMLRQMETFPVILAPVCGIPAFRHRERRWPAEVKPIGLFEAMMPATLVNLLGFPSVAIPFGRTPEGLPVGVQFIGRPYSEELLLELAVRLEEARGPYPGPPGY